jgi:chemotaxis protein MotB
MASLARRNQRDTNIWPGFVDALATLLLVLIFLLMIFVLAQFFLNEAITSQDSTLKKLENQVSELADLLALERKSGADMRLNITQLSEELQSSVATRDDLNAAIEALTIRAEGAEGETKRLAGDLYAARKTIDADKETIRLQVQKLAALGRDIQALEALRDELRKEVADLGGRLQSTETKAASLSSDLETTRGSREEERRVSETARAQVALLNRQMTALRAQLRELADLLESSERKSEEQQVQITNLGKRLNAALASKVQELARYRSEFFGRLRQVLGDRPGIRVVGDRFVFQSEVLFASGSASLGEAGQGQMAKLAATLREIIDTIPSEINWVLRVDGHTDKVPINTPKFPSNWELSTARAISVVKFLRDQGIPAGRLAATGFGEHQPLDARDDEIALRRNRRIEIKLTQR